MESVNARHEMWDRMAMNVNNVYISGWDESMGRPGSPMGRTEENDSLTGSY